MSDRICAKCGMSEEKGVRSSSGWAACLHDWITEAEVERRGIHASYRDIIVRLQCSIAQHENTFALYWADMRKQLGCTDAESVDDAIKRLKRGTLTA